MTGGRNSIYALRGSWSGSLSNDHPAVRKATITDRVSLGFTGQPALTQRTFPARFSLPYHAPLSH
jgi:hypothetical protein